MSRPASPPRPVRLWCLVLAACLLVTPVAAQGEASNVTVHSPTFLDVSDDHPFASDIRALAVAGITRGCDEDGQFFCPDQSVTRGEMAAFLTRALDLPPADVFGFTDMEESVFSADVAAMAAAGITKGCNPPENTLFCANDPVTRAQMASFLRRALDLEAADATFEDVPETHAHHSDVASLAAAGITRGCNPPDGSEDGHRFCPEDVLTRAQMAAFLTRGLQLPAVPSVPDRVRFARSADQGLAPTSGARACPHELPLEVRHAVWGSIFPEIPTELPPTEITVTGGAYDADADTWSVPTGDCADLIATWEPLEFFDPVDGYVVTSPFGYRVHPILGSRRLHAGVDFGVPGGTGVRASATGTVTATEWSHPAYGRMVDITHHSGYMTRYAHLSNISVNVGDLISAGDAVGSSGCTGLCTGPHLHFEVRIDGTAVDPLDYLSGPMPAS